MTPPWSALPTTLRPVISPIFRWPALLMFSVPADPLRPTVPPVSRPTWSSPGIFPGLSCPISWNVPKRSVPPTAAAPSDSVPRWMSASSLTRMSKPRVAAVKLTVTGSVAGVAAAALTPMVANVAAVAQMTKTVIFKRRVRVPPKRTISLCSVLDVKVRVI